VGAALKRQKKRKRKKKRKKEKERKGGKEEGRGRQKTIYYHLHVESKIWHK